MSRHFSIRKHFTIIYDSFGFACYLLGNFEKTYREVKLYLLEIMYKSQCVMLDIMLTSTVKCQFISGFGKSILDFCRIPYQFGMNLNMFSYGCKDIIFVLYLFLQIIQINL